MKGKVLVTQSFLTLCNLTNCSLPGSSVHGILQARILEWVVISFSRSFQPRDGIWISYIAGRFFTIWKFSVSSNLPTHVVFWPEKKERKVNLVHSFCAMHFFFLQCLLACCEFAMPTHFSALIWRGERVRLVRNDGEVSEVKSLSRVRLFATPFMVAYQAPPCMGFSRQEYWSGLPFPSPGDLPNPGIEPGSPALQTDALPSEPPGKPLGMMREQRTYVI